MYEEGGLTWAQLQRLRDPHLPQGAPTSAALANLCAFRLDLRLDGLAYALGARYTRYADDIVLSGEMHLSNVVRRVESWVGRIALEEGFTLNHRKTRCLTAGRRQAVCFFELPTPGARLDWERRDVTATGSVLTRAFPIAGADVGDRLARHCTRRDQRAIGLSPLDRGHPVIERHL
jgi:hypothetical protein